MADRFQGWWGSYCTLVVGPKKEEFSVSQGVLSKIPYFHAILENDQYIEAKNKRFELLDCTAEVVADVITFAQSNVVGMIGTGNGTPLVERYLLGYIVADRWGLEVVRNQMVDKIAQHLDYNQIKGEWFRPLVATEQQETALYRVIIDQLAWQMLDQRWTSSKAKSPETRSDEDSDESSEEDDENNEQEEKDREYDTEAFCRSIPYEELLQITIASQTIHRKRRPMGFVVKSLCSYLHKHERTEKCPNRPSRRKYRAS